MRGGGIGLGTLLFLVFLVLKLGVGDTAVEAWSWWWVTAPLWIPASIGLFFGALAVALGALARKLMTPQQKAIQQLRETLLGQHL